MTRVLLAVSTTVAMLLSSSSAFSFECPQHIATAEQQIAKVMADMEGMQAMMSPEDMLLVHVLLDDARMLLEGARHNHDMPQGAFDHARAIAKADSALGQATAADILHFQLMQNRG